MTSLFSMSMFSAFNIHDGAEITMFMAHKLWAIELKFNLYGVVLEMPQSVCGGDILHVMAFAKKFEMPQNRTLSVFLFFLFEI